MVGGEEERVGKGGEAGDEEDQINGGIYERDSCKEKDQIPEDASNVMHSHEYFLVILHQNTLTWLYLLAIKGECVLAYQLNSFATTA